MKHVMIDLYGCNPELLADAFLLHQVLDDYPNRVGMQKVSPVFLRDIKTSCPLDDGLSGFVIIATSHISLHAWPHYGMVNIDIFSCEDFQTTTVGDFAMAMFQTTQIEIHEVERALQSPRGRARTTTTMQITTPWNDSPLQELSGMFNRSDTH
jgi:S-adenosylmethionine decarboxylase